MSDKDKEILTQLCETIPKLDSEKQNYILGVADGMRMTKEREKEKEKKEG